jgi:hypothetical protein
MYVIKDYQKGFEQDQARIGFEVARDWIWPYAYDQEDLLKIHARLDFDPGTRHYCFLGDEMVGYIFSIVMPPGDAGIPSASLDFPRMLPGHEQAAELLLERAFNALKEKSVSRIVGRVTTMCPGDIRLAEKTGFSISNWGYKIYYAYEMSSGKLPIPNDMAQEINPAEELYECAEIATHWYRRPPDWCLSRLQERYQTGVITHLGVRQNGKMIATCLAAPNDIRPSTAAIYYIYTPDAGCLTPMLAKVVNKCVDYGAHNVIADLINEQRPYEPVYQEMGFKKVAEWANCEKVLT